ncbi:MAG TPA: hypothetical protein VF746_20225 [Longimicrobium sp.]|jgi:hypothetical protein
MRGYDRGYDYGLRGYRQAAPRRPPVRVREVGGHRGYDRFRDFPVAGPPSPFPNRVTARYNMDYVREQHPGEYEVNYVPYGGDRVGRVGDMREYHAPYGTIGGTRTWRGAWPVGWESDRPRYDREYRGRRDYRGDYGRWF